MPDLSNSICNAQWISEIEKLLLEAMREVELIGELPISESAFRRIATELRRECLLNKSIQKLRLRPAIFMVSLVFSGRYSHDETRAFWRYYAQDVWNLSYSQGLYNAFRQYYYIAEKELIDQFGFEFPKVNDGDVVRSIYWHTIIPSYLHDDFARWLSKNLNRIRKFPTQLLSRFIKDDNETRYMAPTLQKFMTSDETHDLAVELVRELIEATDMLVALIDPNEIKDIFPSMIHQELWDKLLVELEKENLTAVTFERNVRLEWVWSFANEDWVLRLINLSTDHHQKPVFCVWSSCTDSQQAIWENMYQQNIYPEYQTGGKWRVRELLFGGVGENQKTDTPFGFIYIYDSNDRCIYEQNVPPIATELKSFQFYRITQQRQYAIPIQPNQVTSGQWLISYQDECKLEDSCGEIIVADSQDFYISDTMKIYMNHNQIAQYSLDLPFEIRVGDIMQRIERSKNRYLEQPILSNEYQLPDTTKRLPPVYISNQIHVFFPNVAVPISNLKIHLTSAIGRPRYEPFYLYAVKQDSGYIVNIEPLIPNDQIGNYTLDITYGFKSRLASPIEFSVVPNMHFSLMGKQTFTPLELPSIEIENIQNIMVESPNQNVSIDAAPNSITVTWDDLHTSYCRMHLIQDSRIVPIEWEIERIYAWLEETMLPDRLLPEEINNAVIQFQGKPNTTLQLFVDNTQFPVVLDAKGQNTFELLTDQFRDILLSRNTPETPVNMELGNQRWHFFTFVRRPQVIQFEMEFIYDDGKQWLLIDAQLSQNNEANYEFNIIDNSSKELVINHCIQSLIDPILIQCDLPPGHFNIVLTADNEHLTLPTGTDEFVIRAPRAELNAEFIPSTQTINVTYTIDHILNGQYEIAVLNKFNGLVVSENLDVQDMNIELSANFIPQSPYHVKIKWENQVIGEALPIHATTQEDTNEVESLSYQSPSLYDDHNWMTQLIESPPLKLDPSLRFQLATLDPQELETYSIRQIRRVWYSLARIAEVNQPQHWINKYGFLPTWCLLDNVIAMTTPKGSIFSVYPEEILLSGKTGVGSIQLTTPQEGQFRAYTRWSIRDAFTSRWQIWIPEEYPNDVNFSTLDELDMRPMYYDRLSGEFHGARDRYMMPGYDPQKQTFLVDCVHNYTLLGRINRISTPLATTYDVSTSIDRRYLLSILNGEDNWQHQLTDKSKITSSAGYRYVIQHTLANYANHKSARKSIKALVNKSDGAQKLRKLASQLPKIYQTINHSLIIGAIRFFNGMKTQIPQSEDHTLIQLDLNLLALAIILRSFSLKQQSIRVALMQSIDLDESELIWLLTQADEGCPDLLEWAMTWAEIFIVHSSN